VCLSYPPDWELSSLEKPCYLVRHNSVSHSLNHYHIGQVAHTVYKVHSEHAKHALVWGMPPTLGIFFEKQAFDFYTFYRVIEPVNIIMLTEY